MLRTQVNNITTGWKIVISKFIDENPVIWEKLEETYSKELANFDGILEIYPKQENIFRCFNYFNPENTKVVILGQDPYHGPEQAIGLCFGVPANVKVPPSLRNIMKETDTTITDTTLESWAKQGVLMLNSSLTVRQGTPSSHMRIWADFTKYIMNWLAKNTSDTVFVAWGAFAYSKMDNVKKDSLVVSSHPSPLSYSRKFKEFPPFKESQPLEQVNKLLIKKSKTPIKW